jgi:hypothetical protein
MIQIVNTVLAALILAALLGIVKWVTNKADKAALEEVNKDFGKLEVKLDAALLIVGASITRPELAEKLLALTGRMDDKMQRVLADIVQMNSDIKANAKAGTETDKKLDDLPGRVRSLEEGQKRS